jgi:hypothetical protein
MFIMIIITGLIIVFVIMEPKSPSLADAAAEPVPSGAGENCAIPYCRLPEEEIRDTRRSGTGPSQQLAPRHQRRTGIMARVHRNKLRFYFGSELHFFLT